MSSERLAAAEAALVARDADREKAHEWLREHMGDDENDDETTTFADLLARLFAFGDQGWGEAGKATSLLVARDAEPTLAERERAAALQEQLGVMVQAEHGYAIVDYDSLDRLREQLGVARGDDSAGETCVCGESWCCGCADHPQSKPWGWAVQSWEEHYEKCPRVLRERAAEVASATAPLALPSPEQGKQTSETTGTVVSGAGGSERYTYEQVTWAATELILQRDELQHRLSLTAKALTWFYTDHVEEGDPPCPCEGCEKARVAFTANLAPLPTASTTALEALPGHDLAAELTQERGVSQVLAEHLAGASEKLHAQDTDATRLRETLERIAAHPHGGILVNIARVALSGGGAANKEPGDDG